MSRLLLFFILFGCTHTETTITTVVYTVEAQVVSACESIQESPLQIQFSPNSDAVIVYGEDALLVYTDVDEEPLELPVENPATNIDFWAEQNIMLVGDGSNRITFWDSNRWSPAGTWEFTSDILNFVVHPNQQDIIIFFQNDDGLIEIQQWEVDAEGAMQEIATFDSMGTVPHDIQFTNDGETLLFYADAIRAYQLNTGEFLAQFGVDVVSIGMNPDRNELIVAYTDGFAVYNSRTWNLVLTQTATNIFDDEVCDMAIHPGGSRILFLLPRGQFTEVQAPFVARSWRTTDSMRFQMQDTVDIAFSPNGRLIATLAEDATIHVWNRTFQNETQLE